MVNCLKNKIFLLILMLSLGSHPIVCSNGAALPYMTTIMNYFTGPKFAISLLSNLIFAGIGGFLTNVLLSNLSKMWNQDRSTYFKPKKKEEGILREKYLGGLPASIATLIKRIKNGNHIKVRSGKDNPIRAIALVGKPGIGKTYLTSLIVHEAECPVFMASLNDLQRGEKAGVEGRSVTNLFDAAYKEALNNEKKVAIICIDELQNFRQFNRQEKDPANEVTNALLTELSGQHTAEKYKDVTIVVIGTTNSFDKCDDAIKSRFRETVHIMLPDEQEISNLIQRILEDNKKSLPENEENKNLLRNIAQICYGKSFRDILPIANKFAHNLKHYNQFKSAVLALGGANKVNFCDDKLGITKNPLITNSQLTDIQKMTLTIDEFCFLRDEVYGINDDPKQVRKRLEEYQENQFKKAYNLCSDIYPSTVAKSLDKVFWENGQPYKFGNQYLPKPDDVLLAFEDEASLT